MSATPVTQWVAKPDDQLTEDTHGNLVPDFTGRIVTPRAQFPGNSMETDGAAGDTVIADEVLLLQPSTTVKATDEWTLSDGDRYRVLGKPRRYVHPITGTAITQVNLRRIS